MSQDDQMHGKSGLSKQDARQPAPNAEKINGDIKHALRRSRFFPKTIGVSIDDDNVVRHTGAVPSLQNKKTVDETPCAEPGIAYVENDINIP